MIDSDSLSPAGGESGGESFHDEAQKLNTRHGHLDNGPRGECCESGRSLI